eukprot:scaffold3017_cov270-Alexandrium_tamarense.AAC.5
MTVAGKFVTMFVLSNEIDRIKLEEVSRVFGRDILILVYIHRPSNAKPKSDIQQGSTEQMLCPQSINFFSSSSFLQR